MNEKASNKNDHFFDPKKYKRLPNKDFLKNGPINLESFSDKDLYSYCKKVGYNARIWYRRFIATIPEVAKRRLYKKYGYCSINEFAGKLAGVSHANVEEVLRVSEKFKELPKMKALIGEVGLSKLKVVACIVTKDTDGFWAEKVKNMTKSSLEVYVREIKRKESEKTNNENINKIYNFPVIENNIGSTIFQPAVVENRNFLQKFPGEARAERAKISQGQAQISMFNCEKPISQNANQARLENIQNHDKKTFTMQIDNDTEFELRKFKQKLEKERKEPVDWNSTLKEMAKRATYENIKEEKPLKELVKKASKEKQVRPILIVKKESASEPRTKTTRYIPSKIKHELNKNYSGHCAYHGCNKPAENIHHKDGYSITKTHENLIPLCKTHHDFAHQSGKIERIFNMYKIEKVAAGGSG